MFENLTNRFQDIFKTLRKQDKITEDNIKEALREVKLALLEADVSYSVTKEIVNNIKNNAIGQTVIKGVNPKQQFIKIVQDELINALGGNNTELSKSSTKPNIIMLVGLQGAGKTTFAAKLSNLLKKNKKVLLIGADVYRPAAKKQLEVLSKQISVDYYTDFNSNSAINICENGLNKAIELNSDYVIIDTAGRNHIDDILMNELIEIKGKFLPNEILLVVDGMIGQEATNISKTFHDILDITGVVLTKLDSDTRGGAALSIKYTCNIPIKFISDGEKISDVSLFHPERIASRIFGMGDIVSLVEKAQENIDQEDIKDLEKKMKSNKFDFDDFLKQFKMIKKLGSFAGILKYIPGNNMIKDLDLGVAEKEMKKVEAIILSMTLKERKNPELLKSQSRKIRIAKGSGVDVASVNKLIKQHENLKKVMKQFKNIDLNNFKF